MANTITSSNMLLPIPVVGVDVGPDYALNVDACLALIDAHDHSPNKGVQITPNGLNINADLPFGINNATLLRSIRFSPQASALSLATDLGCLYEAGVDLYYNDGNGNQIRITQSGSIVGAAGTITGLPSGTASASYSSPTFTWQSATNTAANMDFRNAILRNSSASSHGLTLSPPSAMAADFTLVLPALPSSNATFLQLDTSGNITAVNTADGIGALMTSVGANDIGVSMTATGANAVEAARTTTTGTNVGLGGVAISPSSGSFSTNSTSFVSVTNLSVSVITSGRPVFVGLVPDGSSTPGVLNVGSDDVMQIRLLRAMGNIAFSGVGSNGAAIGLQAPASTFSFIDTPPAGTNAYTFQVHSLVGQGVSVIACSLIAYEL